MLDRIAAASQLFGNPPQSPTQPVKSLHRRDRFWRSHHLLLPRSLFWKE
jgi:hypothetical protein